MLIKKLDKFIYFKELIKEVSDLIDKIPFSETIGNQLSLQVKDPKNITPDSWYESIGSIKQTDKTISEEEYSYIHPDLVGGYIDMWLNSLPQYKLVRTRLMLIPGRTCYSVHSDPHPRIHIPIITNKQCYICFPGEQRMVHLPADGSSYWVDTTKTHTAINCSQLNRIHLVSVVL